MIQKIIRKFRITSCYKGYPLIIHAIEIAIRNQGQYLKITKDVYPILSQKYNIPMYSVESNIRTIVKLCWFNNPEFMYTILGYKSNKCPSNSEFIEAVAYYIITKNKL